MKIIKTIQSCGWVLLASQLTISSVYAAVAAGTTISNQVTVSYKDAAGNSYTDESNIINITIRRVNALELTKTSDETQNETATPDAIVYSTHTLQNTGNATDTYNLAVANETGDSKDSPEFLIYKDTNNNGVLDNDEKTPITSIEIPAGESVSLIVATKLPSDISESDTLDATLIASSATDSNIKQTNAIHLTFTVRPNVDISLTAVKDVNCDGSPDGDFGVLDLADMASEECAIMHIEAENTSNVDAIDVVLKDELPSYISYKKGTSSFCLGTNCTLVATTDAVDDDAGEYDDASGIVRFNAGDMASGTKASARFSVVID